MQISYYSLDVMSVSEWYSLEKPERSICVTLKDTATAHEARGK
jgi:hypothetical protein